MDLGNAIAVAAAATAAAAYADARWHLSKDMKEIRQTQAARGKLAQAVKARRASLWYAFEDLCATLPADTQCIWSECGMYTWCETRASALRYARFFLTLGVMPRDLVAFYLTNTPDFCFAMLGLWAIGAAPANINCHLAGDALLHCLRLADARILLVEEQDIDNGDQCLMRIEASRNAIEAAGMRIVVLSAATRADIAGQPDAVCTRPPDELRAGVTDDSPVFLLYTSGSTGLPKACHMPVRSGIVFGAGRLSAMGLRPGPGPGGDRWYTSMPLYHGTGGTTAMGCLSTGVTLCIGCATLPFDAARFWRDVRASEATVFSYVGETARYLLAAPENSALDRAHNVRIMYGNGMRPDVWQRFQDRFGIYTVAEFFHSSEGALALINVAKGEYFRYAVGHHGALLRWRNRHAYAPVAVDTETGSLVRNPATGFARRVPLAEGGEIVVRVVTGREYIPYWRNEAATLGRLERDVFVKDDCYYRTGDAMRRTDDGMWFFVDRAGDSFCWRGEIVITTHVAETLGCHEGIAEAIVYGVAVPGHDGRAGMATLILKSAISMPDLPVFLQKLMTHCKENMSRNAIPVFLRIAHSSYALHNNKQNKIPLKKDGFDVNVIYNKGEDAEEAMEKGRDLILWWPAGLGKKNINIADEWVMLRRPDWERIIKARNQLARL